MLFRFLLLVCLFCHTALSWNLFGASQAEQVQPTNDDDESAMSSAAQEPFSVDPMLERSMVAGQKILDEMTRGGDTACWRESKRHLAHAGCKSLTYNSRAHLALRLANCHLEASGLQTYACGAKTPIKQCIRPMGSDANAFGTYNTFFAHVDHICAFVQSAEFRESTERAVNQLYSSTIQTAQHLKKFHTEASKLAEEFDAAQHDISQATAGVADQIDALAHQEQVRHEQQTDMAQRALDQQQRMLANQRRIVSTSESALNNTRQQIAAQQQLADAQIRAQNSLEIVQAGQDSVAKQVQTSLDNQDRLVAGQSSLHRQQDELHKIVSTRADELAGALQQSLDNEQELLSVQSTMRQGLHSIADEQNAVRGIVSATQTDLAELHADQKRQLAETTASLASLEAGAQHTTQLLAGLIQGVAARVEAVASMDLSILSEMFVLNSVVFYIAAATLGYLLTATRRTQSARIWIFAVVSAVFCLERVAAHVVAQEALEPAALRAFCTSIRQAAVVLCAALLVGYAWTYRDWARINNQTLECIQRRIEKQEQHHQSPVPMLVPRCGGSLSPLTASVSSPTARRLFHSRTPSITFRSSDHDYKL